MNKKIPVTFWCAYLGAALVCIISGAYIALDMERKETEKEAAKNQFLATARGMELADEIHWKERDALLKLVNNQYAYMDETVCKVSISVFLLSLSDSSRRVLEPLIDGETDLIKAFNIIKLKCPLIVLDDEEYKKLRKARIEEERKKFASIKN